jgi:hypothetical protein
MQRTASISTLVLGALTACVVSTGACVAGDSPEPTTSTKDTGTPSGDSTTPGFDTSTPGFDTSTPGFDTATPPSDTGTPGTDTTPPPPVDSGPCSTSLIDDMEADGGIKKVCGRQGFWYTYNDATTGATQTPLAGGTFVHELITPARGSSTKAAHTTGSAGFTTWGAGMAFDLNNPGGTSPKSTYSAAAYTGITFFAKASATITVRVNVSTPPTEPGPVGSCTGTKCSDHYGKAITLSTAWTPVTLTFGELAQQGWGTPATFDKSRVIAVQFQVDKSTAFDFWIDDIAFTP